MFGVGATGELAGTGRVLGLVSGTGGGSGRFCVADSLVSVQVFRVCI